MAIVAGANTTIGACIARELSRNYSAILLLGADSAALTETSAALAKRGVACLSLSLDLHSPSELRRVVEGERGVFGRAAALVCVGADWAAGPADQLGFEDFNAEAIPADCAGELAGLLLPAMIRQRFGRIVLVTPCLAASDLPETGVERLEAGSHGAWSLLGKQVGRSRTTINAISPAYSAASLALDSINRQIRYLGLNRSEVMRFLCRCEEECSGGYSELVPVLCRRLASTEAEFINGMRFLLPLLAKEAAA